MTTRAYAPGRFVEPYVDKSTTNVIEQSNRPTTTAAVGAQWMHNLGGGLGAGVVWVAASFAVHGAVYWVGTNLGVDVTPWPNPVRVGVAAFVVGCGVFGLLMALRASLDEIVQAGEWNALQAEYDALEIQAAESDAAWSVKYQALLREHNELRANYRIAVTKGNPDRVVLPAQPQPVQRQPQLVLPEKDSALSDAIELMRRAYANQPWSRDYMIGKELGSARWGKQRWMDAREHLIKAHVLSYGGANGNVAQWTYPEDMDTALLRLEGRQEEHARVMSS
jgi:hypothetical protein